MTTLQGGSLYKLTGTDDSWASWLLASGHGVQQAPDGHYVAVQHGSSVDIHDDAITAEPASGTILEPGFYWLDMRSDDYVDAFDWIRSTGAQPIRTSETEGRAWVLLEVPAETFIPAELQYVTGDWTPAPNGRETTLQDVVQSEHARDWKWEATDKAGQLADTATGLATVGLFAVGGIALFALFGRRR